jgi:hypothetical protein
VKAGPTFEDHVAVLGVEFYGSTTAAILLTGDQCRTYEVATSAAVLAAGGSVSLSIAGRVPVADIARDHDLVEYPVRTRAGLSGL